MNADRLFALYDRVAEAPAAVDRLRRFVLDLAVRGKLVEQDPVDEPALELLNRIDKAKDLLAGFNRAKKSRALPPINPREVPFELPPAWQWVYFGDIVDFSAGRTPPRKEPSYWNTGDFPWISIADMADGKTLRSTKETVSTEARLNVFKREPEPPGTMIMSFKLTIGKIAKLGIPAFHNEAIISIRPHVGELNSYLFKVLPDLARGANTKGAIKGATLNRKSLSTIMVPLPPLAEQRRIVAKVDELMAVCDRLEETRTAREETRDRLTKASLTRLIEPDIDAPTFRSHAHFAVDALPALTARADQIKHLRQTILNLAVRGKLVEQDPSDEPASELIKRIDAEKRRLVKAGVIRKPKPLPSLEGTETPFDLPEGWAWTRLGHLSQFVTSGSRGWAKHYSDQGAIFVRMGNLSKDHYRLRLDQIQRVKPPLGGEGTRTRLKGGDILISITGNVGMLGLIPKGFGEAYINQHTAMVRPMPEMKGRYLAELFRSPFAQKQFNKPQRGIKNSFRLTDVTQLSIPLPPLAEQRRIVAKVDELMALCGRMETGLAATDGTRTRLLDSLLHDALASAAYETAKTTRPEARSTWPERARSGGVPSRS